MEKIADKTKKSIPKEDLLFSNEDLKKLIVPLVIEQLLVMLVGMIDTVMVSSVGEAAISGTSLVDMINIVLINIFAALATGGAVVTSQFIGAKKYSDARESARQLLFSTTIVSLLIAALTLIFKEHILRLLFGNIETDVMKNAVTYFILSALSYPFLALYNACGSLYRAMGNSKISMQMSLLMNVINIAGNAVLIYGCKMGVMGAGIATLISRAIAAVVILIKICKKSDYIYINLKQKFSLKPYLIKKIMRIGVPNGLENSLFQLGKVLIMSIVTAFGTNQIAANAVSNNFASIGCIPGQAMNLAMITVIGRCVGAMNYNQAVYYIKKLLKITYAATIVLNIFILLILPAAFKLYNLTDETLQLARTIIFIHNGSAIFIWPLSFTLPNALRAANDVKFTMVVSVFSMIMFRIMFSYIFGMYMGYGVVGVWCAMIIDWIFRTACFIIRVSGNKWKTLYKTA